MFVSNVCLEIIHFYLYCPHFPLFLWFSMLNASFSVISSVKIYSNIWKQKCERNFAKDLTKDLATDLEINLAMDHGLSREYFSRFAKSCYYIILTTPDFKTIFKKSRFLAKNLATNLVINLARNLATDRRLSRIQFPKIAISRIYNILTSRGF